MYMPKDDTMLAGPSREGRLPPGVDTASNAEDLRTDQTPDSYGHDLSLDGKVGKGTIPTGTTRITKTVTLNLSEYATAATAVPCLLEYGRLWNITGLTNAGTSTTLKIGAPNIENDLLYQATDFAFNEDAQPIVAIVPFGAGSMAVIKSTGSYIVENVYDPRGTEFFRRSSLIQELAAGALAQVTEMDGVLYVSNANGLISYQGGKTTDLTAAVRDSKTNFGALTLKCDYIKKRVIASTSAYIGYVYDVPSEKLHRYTSQTAFRWTTPARRHPKWYMLAEDGLRFVIEHGDTADGILKYQTRIENEQWSDEEIVNFDYDNRMFTVVHSGLRESVAGYTFQVRITDLTANKYIKEIRVDGETWND